MSICIRVCVLIFLLIFTACAVCSSLFPQFRVKGGHEGTYMPLFSILTASYNANDVKIDYWHVTGKTPDSALSALTVSNLIASKRAFPTTLVLPAREAFDYCGGDLSTYFIASGALAIAGAAFGGLATLLAAGHLCTTANCCLACSILIFCLAAFACMAVPFALMIVVYLKNISNVCPKFKNSTDLVEGFGLSVAASGGFLITAFFELCA